MPELSTVSALPRTRLHLQVLGRFRLSGSGTALELGTAGRRLVALLALHGGRASRSWVAGQLWTDSDDAHAASSLRAVLHRLPDTPGRSLVEADRDEVRLGDGLRLDLDEAAALARRLDGQGSDPGATFGSAQVDLLREDVLEDWYDPWVDDVREQHRQRRLHALERMCERLRAHGRYGLAVEAGLACLAAEPLRESAHRVVIETHLAENNVGEALRQYQACRRTLASGLGIAPSADLDALLDTVVRGHRPGLTAGAVTAS